MKNLRGFLMLLLRVCLGFWVGGGPFVVVRAGPTEGDVYTAKELKALERFKPLVMSKIPTSSLIQNYKNDDLYWMQFLRFKNLDVREAEKKFLEHLKWREDMRMDILEYGQDELAEFQRDVPMYQNGVTKDGKPVAEVINSEWQVRGKVLAGKMKPMQRWAATMFEIPQRRLYAARAAGVNVSQAIGIAEVGGFNLIEQGCPTCLPLYAAMAVQLEHHYPNLMETVNLINIPAQFKIVLNLVLPLMRPVTRKSIISYPDKAVWVPWLDGLMDKNERGVAVGGTIVRGDS